MKIGVMADSHDNVPMIKRAVQLLNEKGVELVIHAGDLIAPFSAKALGELSCPLVAVFGNNDGERAGLSKLVGGIDDGPRWLEVGGRKIVVAHDESTISEAEKGQAEVVISGHSHEPQVAKEDSRLFLNPGEVGGWLNGRYTVAILDTDALDAEILDLA